MAKANGEADEHGAQDPPPVAGATVSVTAALREVAGQQVVDLLHLARRQGEKVVANEKTRVARKLAAVGGAVRRAADKLHDQDNAAMADYVDSAAERVELAALYIHERPISDLAKDAEVLAKKRPLLFLGGLFVAGLAGAQLLKAIQPRFVEAIRGERINEQEPAPPEE